MSLTEAESLQLTCELLIEMSDERMEAFIHGLEDGDVAFMVAVLQEHRNEG